MGFNSAFKALRTWLAIPHDLKTQIYLLQIERLCSFLWRSIPQSVGLLWTSDQLVAETSTFTTHNTHNRHTSIPVGFEPKFLEASGRRPTS